MVIDGQGWYLAVIAGHRCSSPVIAGHLQSSAVNGSHRQSSAVILENPPVEQKSSIVSSIIGEANFQLTPVQVLALHIVLI